MKKRILTFLLAGQLACLCLAGCGAGSTAASSSSAGSSSSAAASSSGTETTADSESSEAATLADVPEEAYADPVAYVTDGVFSIDDTVLTINGEDVSAGMFFYWVSYWHTYVEYSYYSQYGYTLAVDTVIDEDSGKTLADMLISNAQASCRNNLILSETALSKGLDLTEDQKTSTQELESNYSQDSLLFYQTTLPYLQQAYEQACLAGNLQQYLVNGDGAPEATSEELQAFADENGCYTCRYILFYTADLSEEADIEAQKEAAQALYEELQKESGDDLEAAFAEAQEKYNYDGNTDAFTFDSSSSLTSGFRETVAATEIGQMGLSDETSYGYFLILRLPADEESVRSDYNESVYEAQAQELVSDAEIVYSDAWDQMDLTSYFEKVTELKAELSAKTSSTEE